jgi:N,N'-diacetyllegionaminate synthase
MSKIEPVPSTHFTINGVPVGPGHASLVIGEVAQAHDGSLGTAHAFIDAIADAGAHAVKFQTHIAGAESTRDEPFRVQFSHQDSSRYDYWQRVEFSPEQWAELARHAQDRGLIFLSTPFSLEAVDLLERVGVPAWKIGSGDVGNQMLLDRVSATGLPVLLSSGMSPLSELDGAVSSVRARAPIAVLQCTSEYPTPPQHLGLNLITEFAARYECPVGLSDHSGSIYPSLAAVTLGASVIEVHVTLSRRMFGPDVVASVTVEELQQLVDGARMVSAALAAPVDKDAAALGLNGMRALFTRSLALRHSLPAGATISDSDLVLKKPGTGLSSERAGEFIGKTLRHDVGADVLLREEDFE